jgi:LPS-assembly lipoprotein
MRALALIAVLLITACGFSPMYGTKNTALVKQNLDQVEISIIPDRSGQYLRNALIDRFYHNGYPAAPLYKLTVQPITETISNFDVTLESEATRQQIKLVTQMSLIDVETNKTILTSPLTAVTSNNILESEFSTLITEQSARDAALNDLTRQIERQLSLYFNK